MRFSRDPGALTYVVFDCVLAGLYGGVGFVLAPSRQLSGQLLLGVLVVAAVAMAVGTLVRGRRPWQIAVAGCVLLLAAAFALVALLIGSAAFLAGAYGAFGRGAAALTGLLTVLALLTVGLLPALQLRFLRSARGRRAHGVGA